MVCVECRTLKTLCTHEIILSDMVNTALTGCMQKQMNNATSVVKFWVSNPEICINTQP